MSLHHSFNLINNRTQCPYCASDFSQSSWESFHDRLKMYKVCTCEKCRRQIALPVDFLGSGHDGWDGQNKWSMTADITVEKTNHTLTPLESKVKILSERIFQA
ncbi:MAG: hypothetical protein ACMXYE_00585 [Candidatus Woesearchaeota archaeon]